MNLLLFDFLTQKKVLLNNKSLKIYNCGPTVYDDLHVGNLRGLIVIDVFLKVLDFYKIDYKYVVNITDIDDKIINKAIKQNKSETEISTFYTNEFLKLLNKFNIKKPTIMPKVTQEIEGMISFVQLLIEKNLAYEVDGNVFLEIKKIKNYFELVNVQLDQLENENDTEISLLKKDPKDFCLWKKTNIGISFVSPWGNGRPGWHTECSWFIYKYFQKETIDIHFGGIDLRFPHHTNEKAQFESLLNKPMAKVWNYVGHVMNKDEKMSKSVGNTFKAKDFVEKYSSNILRNIFFSSSYMKPINIDEKVINTSFLEIKKIEKIISEIYRKIIVENEVELIFSSTNYDEEIKNIISPIFNDLDYLKLKENFFSFLKKSSDNPTIKQFQTIIYILNILGFEYSLDQNLDKLSEFKTNLKEKNFLLTDSMRKKLFIIS